MEEKYVIAVLGLSNYRVYFVDDTDTWNQNIVYFNDRAKVFGTEAEAKTYLKRVKLGGMYTKRVMTVDEFKRLVIQRALT